MSLVITCPRHFEEEASLEIGDILEEMGDDSPKIVKSDLSGIIRVDSSEDPVAVSRRIREKIHDEPWTIRYIQRSIPIEKWILTDLEGIVDESKKLAQKISPDEKYRITIEKRNSSISAQEIITGIADGIKNKVSLDDPDRIVLVEIFGGRTGLAVLADGDITSVEKERRAVSE